MSAAKITPSLYFMPITDVPVTYGYLSKGFTCSRLYYNMVAMSKEDYMNQVKWQNWSQNIRSNMNLKCILHKCIAYQNRNACGDINWAAFHAKNFQLIQASTIGADVSA